MRGGLQRSRKVGEVPAGELGIGFRVLGADLVRYVLYENLNDGIVDRLCVITYFSTSSNEEMRSEPGPFPTNRDASSI